MSLKSYAIHPLAKCFPEIPELVEELAESIKAVGLQQPVLLYEGLILDGRHRAAACALAGVELQVETWDGDVEEAAREVWNRNGVRRQLSAGQRAAARVALDAFLTAQRKAIAKRTSQNRAKVAKGRVRDSFGRFKDAEPDARKKAMLPSNGAGHSTSSPSPANTPVTRAQKQEIQQATVKDLVAATAQVSPRTSQMAITVGKRRPDLLAKVNDGTMSLPNAYEEARHKRDRLGFYETTQVQIQIMLQWLAEEEIDWEGKAVDPCAGRGAIPKHMEALCDGAPVSWQLCEIQDRLAGDLAQQADILRGMGRTVEVQCPQDFLQLTTPDKDVAIILTNLPWPEPGLQIVAHAFRLYPHAACIALCDVAFLLRDWAPNGQPRAKWLAEHMPDFGILPGRGHPAAALAFEGQSSEYREPIGWMYWPLWGRNRTNGTIAILDLPCPG